MKAKMAVVLFALLAERVWKLYKQFSQKFKEERCGGANEGTNHITEESPFILGLSIAAILHALIFLFTEAV